MNAHRRETSFRRLLVTPDRRMFPPEPDHFPEKPVKFLVGFQPLPVQPGNLIILTIRIIISKTGVPEFISCQKHGRSPAAHQSHTGVFHHLKTKGADIRILRFPFHSAVPAPVVVISIRIIPAVGLVMFPVIRIKIPERKTVMAGEEIDGRIIAFILTGIEI